MGPSATYHLPEGEGFETSVEHGLCLWAEPRWRVLLAVTEPFFCLGKPVCRGT